MSGCHTSETTPVVSTAPEAALPSEMTATRVDAALVYRRYRAQVYHLALRYAGGDEALAEDVTQDVFVTALRKLDSLTDQHDLGRWFYRVTTNRCLKRLRRDRMLRTPLLWLLGGAPKPPSPETHANARAELKTALSALCALPPKERVAFSMYHLDGRSQHEICAVMGHSKGYVSKLISRATDRLRASGWEVNQ